MKNVKILTILVFAGLVFCLARVGRAASIGTAFTYQGRLIDANRAADGLYDFQFKLFDSASDGNQLGTDVNKPEVDVIDGYFTVELDFGGVFDGNERWLDIGVRPGELSDPNLYTTLNPRQEVTPTPYAIHAKTSGVIVMWSGSIANIPAGWALCDGNNGTPDLRDRFILGVAAGENPGATGGNHNYTLNVNQIPSHSHSISIYSAGEHTHTCQISGNHQHTIGGRYFLVYVEGSDYGDKNGSPHYAYAYSQHTDSAGGHSHTIDSAGSHSHSAYIYPTGGGQPFDNRPAYYKLAFIMKL
jgi:microcystin-dependent protein